MTLTDVLEIGFVVMQVLVITLLIIYTIKDILEE